MISLKINNEKRTVSDAPGFRNVAVDAAAAATAATVVAKDDGRDVMAPRGFQTDAREEKAVEEERRPLEWDELDRFDELVDASTLSTAMQRGGHGASVDLWADPAKKTQWCGDVYAKLMAMQTDVDRDTWRQCLEHDDGSDLGELDF